MLCNVFVEFKVCAYNVFVELKDDTMMLQDYLGCGEPLIGF